jgi:hypothetical protein
MEQTINTHGTDYKYSLNTRACMEQTINTHGTDYKYSLNTRALCCCHREYIHSHESQLPNCHVFHHTRVPNELLDGLLINTRALCHREYIHLARKLGITGSSHSDSVNPSAPRATIMCYERLHVDFDGEVTRLAAALGVPLTPAKLAAVRKCVLFARLTPFVMCFLLLLLRCSLAWRSNQSHPHI